MDECNKQDKQQDCGPFMVHSMSAHVEGPTNTNTRGGGGERQQPRPSSASSSSGRARSSSGASKKKSKQKSSFCGCCKICEQLEVPGPYLYAFDFDHTIVDQNSDAAVMAVIHDPVPSNLTRLFDGTNWEEYMTGVFKFIKEEGGTFDVIATKLRELKATDGMPHLLHKIMVARTVHLASKLIVVSDANSFFIDTFFAGLKPPVVPDAIFTNKAEKTEEGVLKLTPYECQTTCSYCPRNLCKGGVLSSYMESAGPFEKVYYIGDGGNDVCPALRLGEDDILFVRKNYSLEKILKQGIWKGTRLDVKARIVLWESAKEIEKEMCF